MSVGKRVTFEDDTWATLDVLRRERRRSFQQLADEAFADLLAKYNHPADLKNQLRVSLGKTPVRRPRRRKAEAKPPSAS